MQPNKVQCRIEQTNALVSANFFKEKTWKSNSFKIKSYYRKAKATSQTLSIYIEGDGAAFRGGRRSANPTPINPVALKLAFSDPAKNVIYLGRPCQYFESKSDPSCTPNYWTNKRFSRKVVDAYHNVLDQIKSEWPAHNFVINGFSGGAAIATILAGERNDIIGLRTIAGNLDHDAVNSHHGVRKMPQSLNSIHYAKAVSNIPQIHFSGSQDKIVLPKIAHSFVNRLEHRNCAQHKIVPDISHETGWDTVWKDLLEIPMICWETR